MGLFSYGISFENPVFFIGPGKAGMAFLTKGKIRAAPWIPSSKRLRFSPLCMPAASAHRALTARPAPILP